MEYKNSFHLDCGVFFKFRLNDLLMHLAEAHGTFPRSHLSLNDA